MEQDLQKRTSIQAQLCSVLDNLENVTPVAHAKAYCDLGELHAASGRPVNAETVLRRSLDILKSAPRDDATTQLRRQILTHLVEVLVQQGKSGQASIFGDKLKRLP
ncbi:hypothetical protein RI367_004593 [Sorochytrium milnesiophthora]